MTEVLEETLETERAERPVLLERTFTFQATEVVGRTLDVRIVPYHKPTRVSDSGRPEYVEEWIPGVFRHQTRATDKVKLRMNVDHEQGIRGVVGHGVALLDRSDALDGTFVFHETQDGEKALALVKAGVLDSVSLEAYPRKTVRAANGNVQRVKADLVGIALCSRPAYPDARVQNLRVDEEPAFELVLEEHHLPIDPDPDVLARCRDFGIRLPQRYAHPAPGTPAETGTPEDGTRVDGVNTTSEVPK